MLIYVWNRRENGVVESGAVNVSSVPSFRTLLSIAGSHGSQENLLFVARKP